MWCELFELATTKPRLLESFTKFTESTYWNHVYRRNLRTGSQDFCKSHQLDLESPPTSRIHRTPLEITQDALDDDRALRVGAGQKYGELNESFIIWCYSLFRMMSFRFWLHSLGSSSGTLRPLTSISAETRIAPLVSSSFIQVADLSLISSCQANLSPFLILIWLEFNFRKKASPPRSSRYARGSQVHRRQLPRHILLRVQRK